jgi:hypothetical protein
MNLRLYNSDFQHVVALNLNLNLIIICHIADEVESLAAAISGYEPSDSIRVKFSPNCFCHITIYQVMFTLSSFIV